VLLHRGFRRPMVLDATGYGLFLTELYAYDSQALSRLGYPGTFDSPVKALFKFPELEDDELLPAPIDRFDARAMPDIHGFVFSSGERLRFTYVDSFSTLD
jgi:hypothetical protein